MYKTVGILIGVFFIGVGILGFVPQLNHEGYLFGVFHLNWIHNLIHIATGVFAIWCTALGRKAFRWFLRVFGIVYGIVALLGIYYGSEAIFGIIANNIGDTILHLFIAAGAIYLGFFYQCPYSDQSNTSL